MKPLFLSVTNSAADSNIVLRIFHSNLWLHLRFWWHQKLSPQWECVDYCMYFFLFSSLAAIKKNLLILYIRFICRVRNMYSSLSIMRYTFHKQYHYHERKKTHIQSWRTVLVILWLLLRSYKFSVERSNDCLFSSIRASNIMKAEPRILRGWWRKVHLSKVYTYWYKSGSIRLRFGTNNVLSESICFVLPLRKIHFQFLLLLWYILQFSLLWSLQAYPANTTRNIIRKVSHRSITQH